MFAITGSIGTGKSTVCEIIKRKDYLVYDCDKIVHDLYMDQDIINKVKEMFPSAVINNLINRKVLGEIVFNNIFEKKKLENLIHPFVYEELKKIDGKNVFVEVPLLFESHMEGLFDKIICVSCNKDLQIKRVMDRNNVDSITAIKIIKSQMDLENKEKLSDYVIYNNGDLDKLNKEVKKLLENI